MSKKSKNGQVNQPG